MKVKMDPISKNCIHIMFDHYFNKNVFQVLLFHAPGRIHLRAGTVHSALAQRVGGGRSGCPARCLAAALLLDAFKHFVHPLLGGRVTDCLERTMDL